MKKEEAYQRYGPFVKITTKNVCPTSLGLTLLLPGRVFRTLSIFGALGDPLTVKYIEMFHAAFSYLYIY